MSDLEKTNKFLEKYNFLRPNQEGRENMNRVISRNENKSFIKKLPMNHSS